MPTDRRLANPAPSVAGSKWWSIVFLAVGGCAPHPTTTPTPAAISVQSLLPAARDSGVTAELIEMSREFLGVGLVIYGQATGSLGVLRGDTLVYQLPASGILRVQPPEPWGYTATFIRVVGDRAPLPVRAECNSGTNTTRLLSGPTSACWLPRVLLNVPNTPAYISFYVGPSGILATCSRYGIGVVEHVMFGSPIDTDNELAKQCAIVR